MNRQMHPNRVSLLGAKMWRQMPRILSTFLLPMAVILTFCNQATADPLFNTKIDIGLPHYARHLSTDDLDGDGHLDLVAGGDIVYALLGNGDGTFQEASGYSLEGCGGVSPVVIGDLNGDGDLDLAVGCGFYGRVDVLLGNGDGTFQNPTLHSTGGSSNSGLAMGDLDGDTLLDLVATNRSSDSVSVLMGNGDGTFEGHIEYGAGDNPVSVAMQDLNGDNDPDLAVANYDGDTVSVLLGNGDGTFQDATDFPVEEGPRMVALADLDGDNAMDLAVASYVANTVSIFLGNGDGSFQSPTTYTAGDGIYSVAIGNLDGGTVPDLIVGHGDGSEVAVLLGNGDGSFQGAEYYEAGSEPSYVTLGDFDEDSYPDLAVRTRTIGITVLLQATICVDLDGDGYGTDNMDICPQPGFDCDDADPDVNPGATEICNNGIDDECDGLTDNDDTDCPCLDNDGDGYGDPAGASCTYPEFDCDDTDPDVNPGATEICGNGIDDECDGFTDYEDSDCPCLDDDADGYGQVSNTNCTYPQLDCDDTNPDVNPGAAEGPFGDPTCNDTWDNDCDGLTDYEDSDCPCLDNDTDGYGQVSNTNCTYPELDCDDTNPDVNPGAVEGPLGDPTCSDTLDNDCDDLTDLDEPICQVCVDNDGDGYGVAGQPNCTHSEDDCDDTDSAVNPGMTEVTGNGKDDDCDPRTGDVVLFHPKQDLAVLENAYHAALGYLNGDIHLDMAVVNRNSVSIRPGNGDGTFKLGPSYDFGTWGVFGYDPLVAIGDLHGDSKQDLVVAVNQAVVCPAAVVFLLKGLGNGYFVYDPQDLPIFFSDVGVTVFVQVADVDMDTDMDVVLVHNLGCGDVGYIRVMLNNGDGTFSDPVEIPDLPWRATSAALANLDGDAYPDLAVTAITGEYPGYSGQVFVFLGNGDGTWGSPVGHAVEWNVWSVAAGDLNHDTLVDLVVTDGGESPDYTGSAAVLLGNGDGTFQGAVSYSAGEYARSVAIGDVDEDGHPDLTVANNRGDDVSVLLGNGDGSFWNSGHYAAGGNPVFGVLGDLNEDSHLDLTVINNEFNTASVLMNYLGDPPPNPAWAAASVTGTAHRAASQLLNHLLVLIIPFGALLVWRERRRGR